jgi:hypothetical protein
MGSSPTSDRSGRSLSRRPALWLPLLLAAAVRLALIAAGPAPELWEYDAIARHLLNGDGYVYEHFDQPQRAYYSGVPYVALTAATYRLWPESPKAMLVVQTLIGLATVAVAATLAARLAGPIAGLAAGVLTALHPGLVYYDVRKLHPLGLDTLLTVAPVLMLLGPLGRKRAALAGVVVGLGVLQRGSLLPFAVFACAWIAAQAEAPRSERMRRAALCAAAATLVLVPWLLRNQGLFGRPLLATGNGYRFFIGNVPPSTGSALLPSGEPVLDRADPTLLSALPTLDEAGQDRLFWERSLDFVRARPATFARQVARKLASFWTWTPAAGALYPASYRWAYIAFYLAVLVAAAVGARRLAASGERRVLLVLAALFVSISLVHAVFYVELRHRWALEPLLLVLAACARPWDHSVAGRDVAGEPHAA